MLWGDIKSLSELSVRHLDRLEHYFRQYKVEGHLENPVEISERCDREEALRLLDAALEDYRQVFSD